MNKHISVVGIIILFILSTLAPIVIGHIEQTKIEQNNESLNDEHVFNDFNIHLYPEYLSREKSPDIVFNKKDNFNTKKGTEGTINIALLLQKWDYMDFLILGFVVPFYLIRMAQIQIIYKIEVNFKIFWDDFNGGDVQSGMLESDNIDIAIGPGGVGSFYTPKLYREKIKTFIEKGGGFFGICGDSYLGSDGYINPPDYIEELFLKLFKFPEITPPMNLIPVTCDLVIFSEIFQNENTQNNIYVLLMLIGLIFSNSQIQISDTPLPFGESYRGKTINIETGGCPFLLNKSHKSGNYTIIGTFEKTMSPFNSSLFEGKIAIIASSYGEGRVILSPVHPEVSFFRPRAHNLFFEAILWLAEK